METTETGETLETGEKLETVETTETGEALETRETLETMETYTKGTVGNGTLGASSGHHVQYLVFSSILLPCYG